MVIFSAAAETVRHYQFKCKALELRMENVWKFASDCFCYYKEHMLDYSGMLAFEAQTANDENQMLCICVWDDIA